MINPQWLELPMSRTNFHGQNDVRAIEVRLYIKIQIVPFIINFMETAYCTIRYRDIQIQIGTSVLEEYVSFIWSSVGNMRPIIWSK